MAEFKARGWDVLLEETKNRWDTPNEFAPMLVERIRANFGEGKHRVLDGGYGAGRHLKYLLEQGFAPDGFEIAPNAEAHARKRLERVEGAEDVELKCFDMHETPWHYEDGSYAGFLAINVIHHTNYEGFLATVDQIARVLKPQGVMLATIASKGNHKFGMGPRVDAYTFKTDRGAEEGIPHAFFDQEDLVRIFEPEYNVLELREVSGEIPEADRHMKKEGALDHWLVYVEKK